MKLNPWARIAVAFLALVSILIGHAEGQAAWSRGPLRRAVVDLVIGGPDHADDDYLFTLVSGLYVDTKGDIFVGDVKLGNVRIYGPDGKLARTIGRRGEGPGDLRAPCCFTVDSLRRLWVRDYGNNRYTAFDLTDRFARQVAIIRMPFPSGVPYSSTGWDGAGNLIHVARDQGGPSVGGLRQYFLTPTGAVAREVALPPAKAGAKRNFVVTRKLPNGGIARNEIARPFSGLELNAFSRAGDRVAGHMDLYDIDWFAADGRLLRTLRHDVRGPKVSPGERVTEEERLVSSANRLGIPRSAIRVAVPSFKPPIASMGFDLEGRLWVQLAVADGEPHRAHLYSPVGQLLGTMEWPPNVTLYQYAARDSVAIGVAKDADDVLTIVRLKFRPVAGG
jgi:hypothetical protein